MATPALLVVAVSALLDAAAATRPSDDDKNPTRLTAAWPVDSSQRVERADQYGSDSATGRVLHTLATLFLWLKPLHLLRLSANAGPLVLMVGRMLRRDVKNWLRQKKHNKGCRASISIFFSLCSLIGLLLRFQMASGD